MKREEFLRVLARQRTDQIVVTTMGAVRSWGRLSRRPELDFVSADSAMGHAADLALGLALARPDREVVCLNGDGSLLMCLGTLATIASSDPPNLLMIVLQNGVYEITGRQPIPSASRLHLAEVARALGIPHCRQWRDLPQVEAELVPLLRLKGPRFGVAHVEPETDGPIRRGPGVPEDFLQDSLADSAHKLRRELSGC